MKIQNNKNLTQKIIIAIVIMISFNFIAPTFSQADFGGVLLGPVIDLVAGLGDAVMALLQVFMDGGENELLSSSGFLVKSTEFKGKEADYGMATESGLETKEIDADELDQGWFGWGTYSIPIIKYSPEKIFANEVPALDANFINPKTDGYSAEQQKKSIAIQLRETISAWYNALRNLVIVGMLSILLYVGIRMMLTSISSDKAKYKQMIMDWLIALCLLFFLHYIMSFTMTVVQIITDGIAGGTDVNVTVKDSAGDISFKTNLTGVCRMQVQYKDLGTRMVYLIFYIALVVYTFMFTWKYMKRAITMAFLTLMAPLVTLTYPIDKMGDGKAQAFNMWLKEYIFNALLQPFHLIIYTIFLGASMAIAIANPLYAILFLAFITPAEKILRRFFGFDKASTAGASFAGAFGGAAAFNMVKGLVNKGAKGAIPAGGKTKSNSGNIRQQRQLTDPNAPDGSLTPFTNHSGNSGSSSDSASGQNPNLNPNPNLNLNSSLNPSLNLNPRPTPDSNLGQDPNSGLDINADHQREPDNGFQTPLDARTGSADQNPDEVDWSRAQEAQRLREQGLSQDEIVERLNQTMPFDRNSGARTSDDDKRGVLQWGRDAAREKWNNSQLKQNLANSAPVRFARSSATSARQLAARAKTKAEAGIGKAGETYRKIPKPIRNSLERTGRAGIRTIKGAAGVVRHAAPGIARTAGKVAAAGAFGAVGLAMGVAGDDLEDTFTYAGAGAALGWSAGPALARGVASGVSASGREIRQGFEEGAYGTEEAALRQQDRDFISNQDNRDFFEERIVEQTGSRPSRRELNETMEVAAEYNRADIRDLKQINKSMLLEQQLQSELQSSTSMSVQEAKKSAREQAMTITKIAQGVDAKDLRDKNKVKQLQDSFARELQSKDSTMTEQQAEAQASRIVAMVKKMKKVY